MRGNVVKREDHSNLPTLREISYAVELLRNDVDSYNKRSNSDNLFIRNDSLNILFELLGFSVIDEGQVNIRSEINKVCDYIESLPYNFKGNYIWSVTKELRSIA